MADVDDAATAQVFEPSAARVQRGPATAYPWLYSFTGEDKLQIASWNSVSGARIGIQGRVFSKLHQRVQPFRGVHTPNTDRSLAVGFVDVPEGELLNVAVFAEAGTTRIGQTFIRLAVVRGNVSAFTFLGTLLQGHVTQLQVQAWPGAPIGNSLDARGLIRVVTASTPAAGAEFSETVPTGAVWEFLAFSCQLAESGGIANTPRLVLDDGSGNELVGVPNLFGVATNTFTYSWLAGLGLSLDAGTRKPISFPVGYLLNPGARIRTSTSGITGATQYSAGFLTVREWLEAS